MPLGRTLRQHIDTLKKTTLAPEFSDQLLEYHYQLIYGNTDKNQAIEKELHKTIRKWRNSHSI